VPHPLIRKTAELGAAVAAGAFALKKIKDATVEAEERRIAAEQRAAAAEYRAAQAEKRNRPTD
jgi:hypothetical protein